MQCFSNALPLICVFLSIAQVNATGTDHKGVSNITTVYPGLNGLFGNPAGVSAISTVAFTAGYESRFLIRQLSERSAGIAIPVGKAGVIGCKYYQFGNTSYKEQQAGISISRGFGDGFDCGIRVERQTVFFEGPYEQLKGLLVTAGFLVKLNDKASIGLTLQNPTHMKYAGGVVPVPAAMKGGIRWKVNEHAFCYAELEKPDKRETIYRVAVEYNKADKFYLRCGVSNSYTRFSSGIGLSFDQFNVDLSFGYHQDLGFSPCVSLSYFFKK